MPKSLVILGTHGIPARHGGFETCAETLALDLVAHGWNVTVFGCGDHDDTTMWRGITCRTVRATLPRWCRYLMPLWYDWRAVWQARHHDGMILTMGYNTALFNCVLWLYRKTQIINMDGMEWQRPKYRHRHEKLWLKLNQAIALRVARLCIADHPVIADYLQQRAPRQTIKTIAYGADPVDPLQADQSTILTRLGVMPGRYGVIIARPEPENQIHTIITAWQAAQTGTPLIILGHYHADHAYHRFVRAMAGPQVIFPGAIYDKTDLAALRLHAQVYLHGHTVGGTNPSLVEAMAAGCLIMAHDNPYNRGTAANGAFYFTDADDLTHLLRNMTDDAQITIMRQNSLQQFNNHYTWPPILAAYREILDNAWQNPV